MKVEHCYLGADRQAISAINTIQVWLL